jgi:hypothetical protein
MSLGLPPQADSAASGVEDLENFGDHFEEHSKTAGRTLTEGAEHF